jgi:hypothetical protein
MKKVTSVPLLSNKVVDVYLKVVYDLLLSK